MEMDCTLTFHVDSSGTSSFTFPRDLQAHRDHVFVSVEQAYVQLTDASIPTAPPPPQAATTEEFQLSIDIHNLVKYMLKVPATTLTCAQDFVKYMNMGVANAVTSTADYLPVTEFLTAKQIADDHVQLSVNDARYSITIRPENSYTDLVFEPVYRSAFQIGSDIEMNRFQNASFLVRMNIPERYKRPSSVGPSTTPPRFMEVRLPGFIQRAREMSDLLDIIPIISAGTHLSPKVLTFKPVLPCCHGSVTLNLSFRDDAGRYIEDTSTLLQEATIVLRLWRPCQSAIQQSGLISL